MKLNSSFLHVRVLYNTEIGLYEAFHFILASQSDRLFNMNIREKFFCFVFYVRKEQRHYAVKGLLQNILSFIILYLRLLRLHKENLLNPNGVKIHSGS